MAKIVFIGGGSSKFIYALTRDLFSFPETQNCTIGLMDIDETRVMRTDALVKKMIKELDIDVKVQSGTNRKKILEGADYIIITIMVGRFDVYDKDIEIPAKYGLYQAVGDTIGPGGVFRFLRTMPVLQDIIKDIREVCSSNAWILNYSNPMAMNVWSILESGFDQVVGLCHSIQGAYRKLAQILNIPPEEVSYTAGGINHVNFYLRLEHKKRDLYPEILAAAPKIIKKEPSLKCSMELLEHFGYFPAEGGEHQSEYYPYFRKNKESIEKYNVPTKWGCNIDYAHAKKMEIEIPKMVNGEYPINYKRGLEYGAYIIHSMETGTPRLFYGNVRNKKLIENHPDEAVVEVPCSVDKMGIHSCRVGRIPEILAAVQRSHIAVHELAIRAAINKNRRLVEQAVMIDPLTSTICTLHQIRSLVKDMFDANKEYIEW